MRIWRIVPALLLCLVLVGLTACNFLGGNDQEEVSQQLVDVVRGDVTVSINGSGTIEVANDNDKELTFSIDGTIDKIYVEENDEVREGNVLAKLDTAALELAVTQAETTLIQTQATLEQAKDEYNTQCGQTYSPVTIAIRRSCSGILAWILALSAFATCRFAVDVLENSLPLT